MKGQGHSLTLVKGHSDFKVKCLTFWPVYSGERFRASWPSCFSNKGKSHSGPDGNRLEMEHIVVLGNENMSQWYWSNDQHGNYVHIWCITLKLFFSKTRSVTALKFGILSTQGL